jgi:predicted glycosyltransferase involved in capsule biosynthesis
MINNCVKECNTPFAANYDADVLINPVQLWYSVVLLRNGKDIVYPYDGMFCHVGGDYIEKIKENMHALIGKLFYSATESFGGCLLFNCKSFMDAGGENEKFVSFGPEDAERFHRFLKIGLDVIRVKGSLYHLDHYRGINSSKQNPFIENNRAEWRKIQALSINKLKEYIETWTWKH